MSAVLAVVLMVLKIIGMILLALLLLLLLALLELIRAGRVRLDETGTLTMDRARRPRNKQNQPTGKEAAADADHTAQ